MRIKQFAEAKVHGPNRTIVVSRLSIWQTALPYFQKNGFLKGFGWLQVTFATFESEEDAVDLGGPRREFFHLLLGAIAKESGTFTSKICLKCFLFYYYFRLKVVALYKGLARTVMISFLYTS